MSSGKPDKVIIITNDDISRTVFELDSVDIEIDFLAHDELSQFERLLEKNSNSILIFDAGNSEFNIEKLLGFEEYLSNFSNERMLACLCMYELGRLPQNVLKDLISFHDQYQLTTSDITVVSGDNLDGPIFLNDNVKKIVRDNLEIIILALLHRGAICGSEIIAIIHDEFKILFSPGTLYPILHSLTEKGLIAWVKVGKEKKYLPVKDSVYEIKDIINDYIMAQSLMNSYLKKEIDINEEIMNLNK